MFNYDSEMIVDKFVEGYFEDNGVSDLTARDVVEQEWDTIVEELGQGFSNVYGPLAEYKLNEIGNQDLETYYEEHWG